MFYVLDKMSVKMWRHAFETEGNETYVSPGQHRLKLTEATLGGLRDATINAIKQYEVEIIYL